MTRKFLIPILMAMTWVFAAGAEEYVVQARNSKNDWKIEEEFVLQGVLVRCQKKLTQCSKDRLAAIFDETKALAEAFAKKHKLQVRNVLPKKIVFLEDVVYRRMTADGFSTCFGLQSGPTLYVGYSGNGEFDEGILYHEMAHWIFEEQSSHGRAATTWVSEYFVCHCRKSWKNIKKRIK